MGEFKLDGRRSSEQISAPKASVYSIGCGLLELLLRKGLEMISWGFSLTVLRAISRQYARISPRTERMYNRSRIPGTLRTSTNVTVITTPLRLFLQADNCRDVMTPTKQGS